MLRKLLKLAAILPLLMITGIWVRSYFRTDGLQWGCPAFDLWTETLEGRLRFEVTTPIPGKPFYFSAKPSYEYDHTTTDSFDRLPGKTLWGNRDGAALVTGERWGENHFAVFVPFWMLVVPALLPATWTLWRKRAIPSTTGEIACSVCGYDLRATLDRCPECGTLKSPSCDAVTSLRS